MLLKNRVIGVLFIVSVPMLLWSIGYFLSQRWILGVSGSPSLEDHFFLIDKYDHNISKWDAVAFPFDGESKYGYRKGDGFAKYIACDEGEWLEVRGKDIYCEGIYLCSSLAYDYSGHAITKFFEYNNTIPKGKFFGYTPYAHSYDSRYWGLISKDKIIGKILFF